MGGKHEQQQEIGVVITALAISKSGIVTLKFGLEFERRTKPRMLALCWYGSMKLGHEQERVLDVGDLGDLERLRPRPSREWSLTTFSRKLEAFHSGRGRWGAASPYSDASFPGSGAWRRTRGRRNWARCSRV
jgi:hypothetical protein